MKNKKMYLSIYLFMAAVILFGFLALIVMQWESSKRPIDGFSKRYQDITIKEVYDSEMTANQFVSDVFSGKKQVRFQKISDNGYSLVYLSGGTLPVKIVEGRNFEAADFRESRNVVLIDKEMKVHTYVVEEKRYLAINGNEYEVIGVFEQQINNIHSNSTVFVNMLAEQMQQEATLSGRYLLEGMSWYELKWVAKVLHNKTVYEIDKNVRWKMVQDTLILPIKIVVIGVVFCFAGFLYMVFMWLNEMNSLMDISILCGATTAKIYMEMIGRFLRILSLAWALPVAVFLGFTRVWVSGVIVIVLLVFHLCMFMGELVVVRKLHIEK